MPIPVVWRRKPPLGVTINWSNPLTRGLVGCWLFNEGGGGEAKDLSLDGNHGALTNFSFPPTTTSGWNPGKDGPALAFDGTNDYVERDSAAIAAAPFTLAVWFYPTDDTVNGYVVSLANKLTHNERVGINASGVPGGDPCQLVYVTAVGSTTVPTGNGFIQDQWNFVYAISAAADDHLIVLNNDWANRGTSSTSRAPIGLDRTSIGRVGDSTPAGYFKGLISCVMIYSRALAPAEALSLYMRPWQIVDSTLPVWVVAAPLIAIPRHPATIFQIPALV